MYYVYADPDYCKCMYVGSESAYATYKTLVKGQDEAMAVVAWSLVVSSRSSKVGPGGGRLKSRRRGVRFQDPRSPSNGRAMTRDTPCSPWRISRAVLQAAYSSEGGTLPSCAAT